MDGSEKELLMDGLIGDGCSEGDANDTEKRNIPIMIVVGKTSPHEVLVASQSRELMVDEYLLILDPQKGNLIGEVVETFSYRIVNQDTFSPETGIFEFLSRSCIDMRCPVCFARVRLLSELKSPIHPFSVVSIPKYPDIEKFLVTASSEEGFVLGLIHGTEEFQMMPESLKDLVWTYQEGSGSHNRKQFCCFSKWNLHGLCQRQCRK